MSVIHRVRLPAGAVALVGVGHAVEPAEVLATWRPALTGVSIDVAGPLRRSPDEAAGLVSTHAGAQLAPGESIASDGRGRQVLAPAPCIFLAYDRDAGTALIAPLGSTQPIIGHVRGEVTAVREEALEISVSGALLRGVGGSGGAVHGELTVAVRDAGDELRAGAIDVGAAGRILVGGSRASAETLTRARAMGVAGIVLGGALDKELRDFGATQARRREVAETDDLAVVVLEGFGKVGPDAELFEWLRAHEGRTASLFGDEAQLYVYDAARPPGRWTPPREGDRVIAHRRPHAGASGRIVRVVEGLRATEAGIAARSALVRFEDGRTAVVPLANLEATELHSGD